MRGLLERPATHLDPDEIDRMRLTPLVAARVFAPQAKFDAARFAAARGVGKCGEIGRTIGDMDAVEQTVPQQLRDLRSQQCLGRGRDELHRAVAPMARNHVAHVARQQAIAVFLDRKQGDAGTRQRFRTEGQPGGVERGRSDTERHEHAAQGRVGIRHRQQIKMPQSDQQAGAAQRHRRGERDHTA